MIEEPPPHPPAQPAPGKKEGLHPLAWVGIGCGGLALIAAIALALGIGKCQTFVRDVQENPTKLVEMAINANPDLELVENDREAETMTIREKKTGKTQTFSYKDIREGKFSIETEEGLFSVDGSRDSSGELRVVTPEGETTITTGGAATLPDWVPPYPGATSNQPGMVTTQNGRSSGSVTFESGDGVETALANYALALEDAGYAITPELEGDPPNYLKAWVHGEHPATARTIDATIYPEPNSGSKVHVTFKEGAPQ